MNGKAAIGQFWGFCAVAAAGLLLWVSNLWLTDTLVLRGQKEMLAKELARQKKQQAEASNGHPGENGQFVTLDQLELPPEAAKFRERVKADPKDEEANLLLAQHLVALGNEKRDVSYLMHGLGAYQAALQANPNNLAALRGLADLCAEQGLFEEAAEKYSQLLNLKPDDVKVRIDYGLVLIQSGKAKEGIINLDLVIKDQPDSFPARLGRALGYRVLGEFDRALAETKDALAAAPDERAAEVAQGFLKQVQAAKDAPPEAAAVAALPAGTAAISPAAQVDSYFRNHPIIGPKLDAVIWDGPKKVRIELKDFPVEAMPQAAREIFLSRAKTALAALPEQIVIDLIDADLDRPLLQFTAGGDTAASGGAAGPQQQP